MFKIISVVALAAMLVACNQNDKQAGGKEPAPKEETTASLFTPDIKAVPPEAQDKPHKGQYCTIARAFRANDTTYIEADYIEFLMGDAAIEAAKKHGEEGVVLDDYYVVNDNTKLRTLPLANNVVIELVQADSATKTYERSFETLGKFFGGNTLFVLTIDNGVVQKIKQQYLP